MRARERPSSSRPSPSSRSSSTPFPRSSDHQRPIPFLLPTTSLATQWHPQYLTRPYKDTSLYLNGTTNHGSTRMMRSHRGEEDWRMVKSRRSNRRALRRHSIEGGYRVVCWLLAMVRIFAYGPALKGISSTVHPYLILLYIAIATTHCSPGEPPFQCLVSR